MRFKRPWQGFKRQFVRCKTCGLVSYFFYQPYSFGNPVSTMPCGHGLSERFIDGVNFISEKQARYWTRRK